VKTSTPSQPTASTDGERPPRSGVTLAGTVALVILAVGGLNWGAVALFERDLVGWLFGDGSVAARIVYVVVAAAAVYGLIRLPRWSRAG
jgi:uncharacterized membrane protein YuzA (DUF378 family)